MKFLHLVSHNENLKMSSKNIGIVFAPALLSKKETFAIGSEPLQAMSESALVQLRITASSYQQVREVVQFLIEQYTPIFQVSFHII
jgi:hypothetical protein